MAEKEFLEVFGFMLGQEFAKAAPKDTGKLARSFPGTMRVRDNTITYTVPKYWEYVEFGTKPHKITPKNKKALSFKTKGGDNVVVKSINHPGTSPNPFVRDTFNRKAEEIMKQTIDFLNKK